MTPGESSPDPYRSPHTLAGNSRQETVVDPGFQQKGRAGPGSASSLHGLVPRLTLRLSFLRIRLRIASPTGDLSSHPSGVPPDSPSAPHHQKSGCFPHVDAHAPGRRDRCGTYRIITFPPISVIIHAVISINTHVARFVKYFFINYIKLCTFLITRTCAINERPIHPRVGGGVHPRQGGSTMTTTWEHALACARSCPRCNEPLGSEDERILSVHDHGPVRTGCKKKEETRPGYGEGSKRLLEHCMNDSELRKEAPRATAVTISIPTGVLDRPPGEVPVAVGRWAPFPPAQRRVVRPQSGERDEIVCLPVVFLE